MPVRMYMAWELVRRHGNLPSFSYFNWGSISQFELKVNVNMVTECSKKV